MAWFKCGGGGIPAILKSLMNSVFNKKFGTAEIYPPETWPDTVNLMGPLEEKTVSGSIVTFDDGSDDVPLKKCEITVPANLTGVSSVNVVHGGKNFVDDTLEGIEQGSISSGTGSNANSNNRVRNTDYILFPLDKIQPSYVLTIPSGYKIAMRFYDKNKNFVTPPAGAQGFINTIPSGYVGQGVEFARFIFARTDDADITPNDMKNVGFQLEVGSTATAYEPYIEPATYTVALGRTIYGGTPDIVNGTGADVYTFDVWDGTQNYNVSDNLTNVFRFYLAHEKPLPDPTAVQCICDGYTFPRAGWASDTVSFYSDANNFTLKLPKSEVTTIEQAKAWLTQHNVTFLYATTPEEFTFPAVPVNSWLDDNTLWSDDGDLEVVYRSTGTETIIQPTLVTKEITENGTYNAAADNADGYSSVTVNVPTGAANIETVLRDEPLIEITGVSGTDVSRTMWTRTAAAAEKIVFHPNTKVKTNTGSNDGYFKVLKNSVVVVSAYANTSTTTSFTIPDIELSAGDVVEIVGGFDNSHTSCWFDLYSTITILSSGSAPVLGLGLGNPGPVNESEQEEEPDAAPEDPEEIQEETPEEVDQNEVD